MSNNLAINLRRIRKSKKLTQQQLAEKANISRNAYRSIESGGVEPRVSNLNAIARALEVSVFDITAEVPKLKAIRFRSLKSLTAAEQAEMEQIKVDVANWLNDFNELEKLLKKSIPYRLKEIDLTGTDPKKAASEARKELEIEDCETIGNICRLLESAGIKIMQLKSKLKGFFGLSIGLDGGGPAIVVNADGSIPVERQIFSAAHELGHLLLHIASYRNNQIDEDKKQEKDASIFASYLLMPQRYFEDIWSESRGLHWVDRVLYTKRCFQVSYKTVLKRLIDEGAADEDIHKLFFKAYNDRFKKRLVFKEEPEPYVTSEDEPAFLSQIDFIEDRFSRMVRDALEKNEISMSRAAEILNISLAEMRERVEAWEMIE